MMAMPCFAPSAFLEVVLEEEQEAYLQFKPLRKMKDT